MKILKKISIGSINGVRGGFNAMALFGLHPNPNNKDEILAERETVTVMTVIGIVNSYAEKTSETMGVSFAFKGEFQAINKDGEKCVAPICFLPEPAQSLIKTALDDGNIAIEVGFMVDAVRADTALKGYEFVLKSLQEPKASTALEHLTQRLLGSPSDIADEPSPDAVGESNDALVVTDKRSHRKPR